MSFTYIYFLFTDSISYNDFCDIMRKEKPLDKDSMLKAFKCIDTNGDGFITHDELFRLLTKVKMFSCFLRYINPFHSQH